MHFQLLLLFACGGDEEVQMLPTNSFFRIASPGGTGPRSRRSSARYPGTDSVGDGQWSLERAVLEMVTGAGSTGDGHWNG